MWGPSTTASDKKGREYPTPGMAKETQEIRDVGEDFLTDQVVVARAQEDVSNLGVVLRDGTLGWWKMRGDEVGPVEIDLGPLRGRPRRAVT